MSGQYDICHAPAIGALLLLPVTLPRTHKGRLTCDQNVNRQWIVSPGDKQPYSFNSTHPQLFLQNRTHSTNNSAQPEHNCTPRSNSLLWASPMIPQRVGACQPGGAPGAAGGF